MDVILNFLPLLILGMYIIFISLYNILIGKGIIKHPMFDTAEKLRYIKLKGIIGLTISGICTCFFVIVILFILL